MKKIVCILVPLVMVSLLVCGCTSSDVTDATDLGNLPTETDFPDSLCETWFGHSLYDDYVENGLELEEFSENIDLVYRKISYNGFHWSQEIRACWIDDYNLTSTSKAVSYTEGILRICSMEEYVQLLEVIDSKRNACLEAIGVYSDPVIVVDTLTQDINDDFFQIFDLFVVDYCENGSPFLRSRLDSVVDLEDKIVITISLEADGGSTGDQPGELYLIPIPNDIETVEVVINDTAWERY